MAIHNTSTLALYTRQMLQNPDKVFLPDELLAQMLDIAYDEFCDSLPNEMVEVSYTPTALTGTFNIDLNGLLFQSQAVQVLPAGVAPCKRMTRVIAVDGSTGRLLNIFDPASSFESLGVTTGYGLGGATANAMMGARWWLDGKILRFNRSVSGTIQIWYQPLSLMNWNAAIAPGANLFIEGPQNFLDLIALYVGDQYFMPNGQPIPAMASRLARRKQDLIRFFAQTRSGQGSRYIQ